MTDHGSAIRPTAHPPALGRVGDDHPHRQAVVPFHLDQSAQLAADRGVAYRAELDTTTDPERRATLLAMLAVAESLTAPTQFADTLAEADRMAELAGTAPARVYTALARFAVDLSPQALPKRDALAREVLDLLAGPACAELRPALLPVAYFLHLGALLESGDIRALDEALSPELHTDDLLTPVLNSRYATWFRCARACMDGQLSMAERLADEGHVLARELGDVDAEYVWAGQVAIIRWMQGRVSEMEPIFLRARQIDPAEPVWAVSVAWIWTHQGRLSAARGLIASLPEVERWRRGRNYLVAAAILAEVAAEIGSDDLVEQLRRALAPFADRIVPIGLGIMCWGTVARPLALLARRQGRRTDAIAHYEAAIEMCSRFGAQAWLAQAQVELAALLLEHGDQHRARALTTESLAAARHLGLRGVEQRADRLLGRAAIGRDGRALTVHGMTSRAAPDGSLDTTRSDAPPRPSAQARPAPPDPMTPPAHVSAFDPAVTERPGFDTSGAGSPGRSPAEWAGPPSATDSSSPPSTVRPLRTAHPPVTDRPRIQVLGEFLVISASGSAATWKSRKARTLLKILVARRGAALARESAMDLLWPGEDPERLRNRLAVAMTAIRKALDPDRRHPPDAFLTATDEVLRLRIDRMSVDVEDFLALVESARAASPHDAGPTGREHLLQRAVAAYTDDALSDEPYAAWAEQLRRQAHLAFFAVAHALADRAAGAADHLQRVQLYRRILQWDPYDQPAHDGLIDALERLGATSHASAARTERHRRLAELGLDDVAL